MQLSQRGAEFIRHHEGFVPNYYLDPVGIPTIGIGFTWRSDSFREWWATNRKDKFAPGAKITRAEADDALRYIVAKEYGAAVARAVPQALQHVFDGAVSPVYNLGVGSLEWNWAQALKRGNYKQAATLLRTTGTTARGKRLRGLINRRKEEAELIEHGDYTIGNAAVFADPMADGVLTRGERGKSVLALQKRLAALGLYDGALDGIFGYGTEAAVLKFQRAAGLAADGYAGPKTLAAMDLTEKPRQPDDPGVQGEPAVAASDAGVLVLLVIAITTAAAWLWRKLRGKRVEPPGAANDNHETKERDAA